MVLHAGIVCYEKTKKGKLVIFNTETRERSSKDVMTVGPGDNNGVDELFKSIQTYFPAQKGCLCICLGNRYDSEIRKKFIDAGKAFGFTKVGITDWLSADYTDLVSATDLFGKIETLKGFIWIFCGKTCRIWRKDGDKARFVRELKFDDTVESLQKIKDDAKQLGKNPDLVIYGDKLKPYYERAKDIFGRENVTVYSELNQENGVLIKARIMGKDKEMKKYATEVLLEEKVELKIGGVPIASARIWQGLPFNQQITIDKPDGVTDLEMFSYFKSNKKWLPDSKKFVVKFNIDVNGICNVEFDTGDGAPELEKKQAQGKKYSSNNSLPTTDSKPKFQPRAPGQGPRPPGNFNSTPQPNQQQQQQQPRPGVVRTNLARQKISFSTSSLASTDSTNSRGGGRGGRGGGGNRGGRGGNRGGRGGGNHGNFEQETIPGLPPPLQPGYNPGFASPQMPQSNPISPNPYGVGHMQQPHYPQQQPFQQQQPIYGQHPSYPTSPQQFPPQMGYPNGNNFGMNQGYPSTQPQYIPPYAPNMHQQFQNMGGFPAPPPPYEKQPHDYQRPAFSLDPNNPSGIHGPDIGNGKEKKGNSKKGGPKS